MEDEIIIEPENLDVLRQHSEVINTLAELTEPGQNIVLNRRDFPVLTDSQWHGLENLIHRIPEFDAELGNFFARQANSVLLVSRFAENEDVSVEALLKFARAANDLFRAGYQGSLDDVVIMGQHLNRVQGFSDMFDIQPKDIKPLGDYLGLRGGKRRKTRKNRGRK